MRSRVSCLRRSRRPEAGVARLTFMDYSPNLDYSPDLRNADMPTDERSRAAAPAVIRYTAFTDQPTGGNPAGIVLDAAALNDGDRLAIARDLGYSETAFLNRRRGGGEAGEYDVRYFSPEAEVPFCGHATIAAAVALAERDGPGQVAFHTAAGTVPVV